MNQFCDTHCHLTLPQFDIDRSMVIQRAIKIGIKKILIPGIDIVSSKQAIRLCETHPGFLYPSVGIHPNTNGDNFIEKIQSIAATAKHPAVVAIGEIGLDYYRMGNTKSIQQRVFKSQLEIADDRNLPVCIHNRDATNDILDILEKHLAKRNHRVTRKINGVFHSFSGDLDTARRIIALGFLLGISGPITYPKNTGLADVVEQIGVDHLVVETDAPYLAPQKVRGQRNQPEYVLQVVEKLSMILDLPVKEVCQITNGNAERLFHWENKKSQL